MACADLKPTMKSPLSHRGTGAFTLVELLTVIANIGILAALLLPALEKGKARAKLIGCQSNLGQMGIAFHSFAHDHNSKFPMQTPFAQGGAQEFVQNGYLITNRRILFYIPQFPVAGGRSGHAEYSDLPDRHPPVRDQFQQPPQSKPELLCRCGRGLQPSGVHPGG